MQVVQCFCESRMGRRMNWGGDEDGGGEAPRGELTLPPRSRSPPSFLPLPPARESSLPLPTSLPVTIIHTLLITYISGQERDIPAHRSFLWNIFLDSVWQSAYCFTILLDYFDFRGLWPSFPKCTLGPKKSDFPLSISDFKV